MDMAAVLPEELVEEIFLRVPADEPAFLVRAALVCKAWRRTILSDGAGGGFLRRYRRFHKTPPLLGFIHNPDFHAGPRFVPTSSFSPPAPPPALAAHSSSSWSWALDCRHGRVLIYSRDHDSQALVIWDPVTGTQDRVTMPANTYPPQYRRCSWAAAVLCGVDGCDHIDCHGAAAAGGSRSAFFVVFVEAAGAGAEATTCTYCASVYSSETSAWSAPAHHVSNGYYNSIQYSLPSLVIGDALYFNLRCGVSILRYDLDKHRLSLVDTPPRVYCNLPVPIQSVDGELGFVAFSYEPWSCIYVWSRRPEAAAGGGGGGGGGAMAWERHRIVELDALLPDPMHQRRNVRPNEYPFDAIRFVEGTNTVLISIYVRDNKGVFALDLKSRQLSKIGQSWIYPILPYMSFVLRSRSW